jgi:hypothetical protein
MKVYDEITRGLSIVQERMENRKRLQQERKQKII